MLLIAPDQVELFPPGPPDAHGWTGPGPGPAAWSGAGCLQLGPGRSDPRAADGGGHGPHDPAAGDLGALFLPPEAAPAEGMAAVIRGRAYLLSQVRLVQDPADPGAGATCWAATVAGTEGWPPDG